MGSYLSRQNGNVEELENGGNFSYIFPPKSGSYFASHFFMGGKKFETAQPEGYLFGDNSDLNYLGPKPNNFSYQLPNGNQPVRALKCLVNIRKDSLRLVRAPNPRGKPDDGTVISNSNEEENRPTTNPLFNLEFTFDADCPCSVTVYYNAHEEMQEKAVKFTAPSEKNRSDTVHYNAGCNQQFCVPTHVIDPSVLYKEESSRTWDPKKIPIAIQVCAECGPDVVGHSHITYAVFDKNSDGSWNIKVNKQKQAINGVCYLFQEIYGIENKHKTIREVPGDVGVPNDDNDDDDDDDNSECVVCLSDMRDTIILPCKHLCLCSSCANQLRFQQSGCPICRQPFRALLQLRAVRKKSPLSDNHEHETIAEENEENHSPVADRNEGDENSGSLDNNVPSGYEVIPLINAVNGPVTSASFASLSSEGGATRTGSLRSTSSSTSSSLRRSKKKKKLRASMDVENEMPLVEGDGSHPIERRKSRSRKKKKSVEESGQLNVEPPTVQEPQPSNDSFHVYVNANALIESPQDESGEKGAGDHPLNISNEDQETNTVEPATVNLQLESAGDCSEDVAEKSPETISSLNQMHDVEQSLEISIDAERV